MARSVAGAAPSRLNRKFLIVAVLLAALSAALVYAKISAKDSGSSTTAAGSQAVVVAKSAIKSKQKITADALEVKDVPLSVVAAGSFAKPEDVVGQFARFPIAANQPIVASDVVNTDKAALNADALALVVPTGKRAISIQSSQVSQAGGLILPGDYVDVLWSCCQAGKPVFVRTLLKNVQVAAVAQTIINSGPVANAPAGTTPASPGTSSSDGPVAADAGKPVPDAVTVTLLLTPEESQTIFLAEQNGSLRAAERGFQDTDLPDTQPVLITQIIPPNILAGLPDVLKPDGFKNGQQ